MTPRMIVILNQALTRKKKSQKISRRTKGQREIPKKKVRKIQRVRIKKKLRKKRLSQRREKKNDDEE
jgi:hypothetical protein